MEQIIVTKRDSSTWAIFSHSAKSVITKAEQRRALLGEDVVNMTVESAEILDFEIGDKITVFGSIYILNSLPKFKKMGVRRFVYDLTWEGRQYDLLKAVYLDQGIDGISISPDFSLTGNLEMFMNIIINNLSRLYGSGSWVLGDCPETEVVTLSFSNENCLAVLQNLCSSDSFDKEFEITEVENVCTINIKEVIGQTHATTYEYGRGKGLYDLTRQTVSQKNIVNRLYAFGSQRNLKSDYRGFSQRLKLPEIDSSYLEDAASIASYGRIEGVKIFEEIYPHRTGTITALGSSVFQFVDSAMDFDLNATDEGETLYLIAGTAAKIHFNSGNLAGYEFELSAYNHSTRTFTIKKFADERGQVFPDASTSAFQFDIGDEYVILDIMMPASYVTAAENELQLSAQAYLEQNSQPRVQYALTFDEIFFKRLNSSTVGKVPLNGLLYNWFAGFDARGIAPVGWHIPTNAELFALETYLGGQYVAGGKLKETGFTHWDSPNTGATNETGFTALGTGYRDNLSFNNVLKETRIMGDTYCLQLTNWNAESYRESILPGVDQLNGYSIRLIRDNDTGWIAGEKIIDYDGNFYDTVKIGTQIWTVQNLAVTHYSNGDAIPEVIDDAEWDALTTGALCAYGNDWNNVFES